MEVDHHSLTADLASWLLKRRVAGIPASALATAKLYVLDWLGSALAGANTNAGRILLTYARKQPRGHSTIIGHDLTGAAEMVAFVNGALSHIVEMDDLDRGSVVHPGAVVIPAALAIAERNGASGRECLSAVVAGYEVAIRIGESVGKRHYHYFHNTSTCGVFGAAAAAGWLLGLEAEQMIWALGNAGTQASGLWQFNAEGSMSKHLHAGRAAAGGILAAELAAYGFTGARQILEGDRGFFAGMAPDANRELVVLGLDQRPTEFKIGNVSIKPHASCRHTHPAIDAALALRPQSERPKERVTIETYQAAMDLCDNPAPHTAYAAKFSLQYCVAVALCKGRAGLTEFSESAIWEPDVRALMARTSTEVNDEYEARYPQQWPAGVRIELADGKMISASVAHPKGDPENPLTTEELEAKFRMLAASGGYDATASDWQRWVSDLDVERLVLPSNSG